MESDAHESGKRGAQSEAEVAGAPVADLAAEKPAEKQDNIDEIVGAAKRLGPAALLAVLWTLMPAAGGFVLLYYIRPVSDWLVGLGPAAPVVFAGAFIVLAGTGLLPTYSQAVLAGWAFGPIVGTLAALIGFVGASLVGFFVARRLGADRVEREVARHPKARVVRDALLRSGTLKTLGIVSLVRLPPNSPFALTNLVLATNRVPLWIYTLGTAVGMLPRTAIVVWLGSHIGAELTKDAISEAGKPKWMIAAMVVSVIVVLFVLSHLANKALDRVTRDAEGAEDRVD